MLLYPVMTFQFTWGGMTSGRIVSDQGLWANFVEQVTASLRQNHSDFAHLWFLYALLAVYALALIVLLVFRQVIDRRGRIRGWIDRQFQRLMHFRWAALLLAIPSAVLLFFEVHWWGVGGYAVNFVPPWQGTLNYALFFAVGWLLYAQGRGGGQMDSIGGHGLLGLPGLGIM